MNRISARYLAPIAAAALLPAANATFVLLDGSANFDLDPAAWASVAGGAPAPGFEALTLDEVFDSAAAAARTGGQILSDELVSSPAYTGILFGLNPASVSNLAGRNTRPTDFAFNPGDLTAHTGVIGLGGVTRWAVNPLLGGGSLLFGDFTLSYDVSRQLVGGTGWNLRGNIAPSAVAFDLQNVAANLNGNQLTITGDLGLSYEVANFLFANPADQGRDMGDFTFTAVTSVPEPAAYAWVTVAGCGLFTLIRRRRS